jgi:hypothetical protein
MNFEPSARASLFKLQTRINKSCITSWKKNFEAKSLEGIKLGYQGAKSYLTPAQRNNKGGT